MAERNFARIGIYEDEQFKPKQLRARDVEATNGVTVETHITSSNLHLTAEQAALIAGALQADELDMSKYQTRANVATYEAMLALTVDAAPLNSYVFVVDASGDPGVESGWAAYYRTAIVGEASDYVKISEGESLDINIPELEGDLEELKQIAESAAAEAAKLDVCFVSNETELAEKNLRNGATVFMLVDNE